MYKSILQLTGVSFYELEMRMWASFLNANKRAKRLPARKAKQLYGKSKKPYTIIHDCIMDNRRTYS